MKLSKLFFSFVITIFVCVGLIYTKNAPPRGDEIHYLITTISILNDKDLWLENNYEQKDYVLWFKGDLDKHTVKSLDGHEYLYHGLGIFPFLIAPGFLIANREGVVLMLTLIGISLTLLCYKFIKDQIKNKKFALIITFATFFSLPLFQYSFLIFPEIIGGLMILLVISLIFKNKNLALTAILIGLLPWVHLRFLPVSLLLGGIFYYKSKSKKLLVSIILVISYFLFLRVIYGSFNPLQPYINLNIPTNSGNILINIINVFIDRQYGLFFHSPIYLLAIPGFLLWYKKNPAIVKSILVIIIIYFFTVFRYYDWNGGFSPPARYLVPILPLILPAVGFFIMMKKNILWKGIISFFIIWGLITLIFNITFPPNFGFIFIDGFAPYLYRISNIISVNISEILPGYYPNKEILLTHVFWLVSFGIFLFFSIKLVNKSYGTRKKN